MVEALDKVSEQLGNTRTVCKKYYVHPSLLQLYEEGKLVELIEKKQKAKSVKGLLAEENVLLNILKAG